MTILVCSSDLQLSTISRYGAAMAALWVVWHCLASSYVVRLDFLLPLVPCSRISITCGSKFSNSGSISLGCVRFWFVLSMSWLVWFFPAGFLAILFYVGACDDSSRCVLQVLPRVLLMLLFVVCLFVLLFVRDCSVNTQTLLARPGGLRQRIK